MPILRGQTATLKLATMVLLLLVAGCSPKVVNPWSPDELSAVNHGDRAIVLLRFTVQDQKGNRRDPFLDLEHDWEHEFLLSLYVGDFDSGGQLKPQAFRILSTEGRNQGWLTLRLPAGYYYLALGADIFFRTQTVFGNDARAEYMKAAPRWRIAVPPGARVVDAGPFQLVEPDIGTVDQAATKIEDETAMAIETARRDLPSLPPPVTRLAVRHTGPFQLDFPPPAQ